MLISDQMIIRYLLAALLKSLKSGPSFSQNFVKIIFILLGTFCGLGDFLVKKSCQKHQLKQQQTKIWAFFQAQCRHTKVETWKFCLT